MTNKVIRNLARSLWEAEAEVVAVWADDSTKMVEEIIKLADDDQRLMFNSGDMASMDYSELVSELHELATSYFDRRDNA